CSRMKCGTTRTRVPSAISSTTVSLLERGARVRDGAEYRILRRQPGHRDDAREWSIRRYHERHRATLGPEIPADFEQSADGPAVTVPRTLERNNYGFDFPRGAMAERLPARLEGGGVEIAERLNHRQALVCAPQEAHSGCDRPFAGNGRHSCDGASGAGSARG